MGCSRKAIAEDEDEYHALCKHFRESSSDGPYSEHARLLKKYKRTEDELHRKHLDHLKQRNTALAKLTPEDRKVLGLSA
ncbi:hypothetical protein N9917_00220 [Deltaproteobacteria bacterium]|nr:hypothetical protein [Deltaproteobacteria bacterium]